jgi:sugar (pentulose or hexulose) kinase
MLGSASSLRGLELVSWQDGEMKPPIIVLLVVLETLVCLFSSVRRSRAPRSVHCGERQPMAGTYSGNGIGPLGMTSTLTGLTLAHGPAQIMRALLEGMCFEVRRCLEVLGEEGDLSFVRISGWIADIRPELQLLADVIGRPVHAFRSDSASALGASLLSGLIDIKTHFVNAKPSVYTPSNRSKSYDELYARYILDRTAFDSSQS